MFYKTTYNGISNNTIADIDECPTNSPCGFAIIMIKYKPYLGDDQHDPTMFSFKYVLGFISLNIII